MPLDTRIPLTVQSPQIDVGPLARTFIAIQQQKRLDAREDAQLKREEDTRKAVSGAIDPATGRPDFKKMSAALASLDPQAAIRAWQLASDEDKQKFEQEQETFRSVAGLTRGILEAPEADRPRRYATARSFALSKGWADANQLPEVYDETHVRDINELATRTTETAQDIAQRINQQRADEAASAAAEKEAEIERKNAAAEEAAAKKEAAAAERANKDLALKEREVRVKEREAVAKTIKDSSDDDKVAKRQAEQWRANSLLKLDESRRTPRLDRDGIPVVDANQKPQMMISPEDYAKEQQQIERLYRDMTGKTADTPAPTKPVLSAAAKRVLPAEKGGHQSPEVVIKRLGGRPYESIDAKTKRPIVLMKNGQRVIINRVEDDGTLDYTPVSQ